MSSTVPAPLSTGVAVAISVVITFIVSVVIGIFIGVLATCLCMRKKTVYSPTAKPTAERHANVGPTAPAGPVYEEVSHKEEIELNTNDAYGQVGL